MKKKAAATKKKAVRKSPTVKVKSAKRRVVKKSSPQASVRVQDLDGRNHTWYVTPNGLKQGIRAKPVGSAIDVGTALGSVTKSSARQVRRALHQNGLVDLASVERRAV